MTENKKNLEALLNLDPMGEAEKVTHLSYKGDEATAGLGMLIAFNKASAVKKAMNETNDTYYSSDFNEALAIIADLGFEEILSRGFQAHGREETQKFFWRKDGVLLAIDSYNGETVNDLSLHYNIEFPKVEGSFSVTSSGHFHTESYDEGKYVWAGTHVVREALRFKLERLEKAGKFLPVWIDDPGVYVDHYGKTGNVSISELIAQFPKQVQDAMAVVKDFG